MKILFIHPSLPTQFHNLLEALNGADAAEVHGITTTSAVAKMQALFPKIQVHVADSDAMREPLLAAVVRAETVARIGYKLKSEGTEFDLIFFHTGWGDGLFLRDVFPNAKIVAYNEAYYTTEGAEVGFDAEFASPPRTPETLRLRNLPLLSQLEQADVIWCPSRWQRNRLPTMFNPKTVILPEGVDTDVFHPSEQPFTWGGVEYLRGQQLVTYTVRNLEPHRGFHTFMRAVPKILAGNDEIKILIAGGNSVSYGPQAQGFRSWKERMLAELKQRGFAFSSERLIFTGVLPQEDYAKLLQVSACHVHLSYPYTASWSLLDAMASQCHIVANKDGPLAEVLNHDRADLISFFDSEGLAQRVLARLNNSLVYSRKGLAAAAFIRSFYRKEECVVQQLGLIGHPRRTQ